MQSRFFFLLVEENKTQMVDSDVLTVVLPYIREDFTAVQFKLLGLLRMLCDGQGELLHLHTTSLTRRFLV